MACYPHPYLPIFESNVVSWMLPFSDETRDAKRIKRSSSMVESIRSNGSSTLYSGGSSICRSSSTNSLNNIPKLHFRDHIWTYTQRYVAAEAVEEAAAAIINAEEGGNEEEGNADGMRLVQPRPYCLSSDLMLNLVFGSTFQPHSISIRARTDRQALSGSSSTTRGGWFCCTHDEHNRHCLRQELEGRSFTPCLRNLPTYSVWSLCCQ